MSEFEIRSAKQQNRLDNGTSRYFAKPDASSPLDTPIYPASVGSSSDSLTAQNTAQPVLTVGGGRNFNTSGATQLAPNLTITGGTNLDAANVFISSNFDATEDRLGIGGSTGDSGTVSGTPITWTYNPTTGVLALRGSATVQQYQDALRTVTYTNSSPDEGETARGVEFSLGRPIYYAPNGHYYEFVDSQGISWTAANTDANGLTSGGRNYFGLEGYLATINTAGEQTFIQDRLAGNGWIGASDTTTPDTWRWVTGPEGLADNGTGTIFWSGGAKTRGGSVQNNLYENWRTTGEVRGDEPNNDGGNESYAHVIGNPGIDGGNSRGRWNDLPDDRDYSGDISAFEPQGYIVEYGGFQGETAPQTRGTINLNFGTANELDQPDFNNDGTPDILWRNYSSGDGRDAIWAINYNASNTTTPFTLGTGTGFIPTATEAGWDMEGIADYDGNGVDDILWRNYSDGRNGIWLLRNGANGIEVQATYFIQSTGTETGWEIEGAKDYDNNGTQDILWRNYNDGRNAIWSLTYTASTNPATNPFSLNTASTGFIDRDAPTDWEMAGWYDMTGDGISDIIWRNPNTGRNAVWGLNGATTSAPSVNSSQKYFLADAPVGWELEQVGDYDDDGIGDFLWRNYTNGDNAIWYMQSTAGNGYIKQNGNYLIAPATPSGQWELEGVADYTGDGIGDLLWRNYTTDETAIWRMRRNSSTGRIELDGGFVLTTRTDNLKWEIEGPNPQNDLL